jgi:hypothetical protein
MYQHNHMKLSRNATKRCQQRGIRQKMLQAMLEHHDLDREVGDNCRILRMSRKRARQAADWLDPEMSRRLERLAVILSDTSGEIVTVFHDTGKTRHYRASF